MKDSYEVKGVYETGHCACYQGIEWNVKEISGEENANGFILQYFSRKLVPADILKQKELRDITYFEAWEVKDGDIVDKGNLCHDQFYIGDPNGECYTFAISVGTKGEFIFKGEVYWISSSDSELYATIEKWGKKTVNQANGLRATYEDIHIDPSFRRCIREFKHSWDLTDTNNIHEEAKRIIINTCFVNKERLCPITKENCSVGKENNACPYGKERICPYIREDYFQKEKERAYRMLISNTEEMFKEKYPSIKQRLINEWKVENDYKTAPSLTNQFVFDKDNPSVVDMLNKLVK